MTHSTPDKNLWYKNYMVTIFVIGLPAFVVVVCIFFIIYAINNQDSTVRDDWYMDGKALYQDASKDQLAFDLGIAGVLRFKAEEVSFELNDPKQSLASYPRTLNVSISHATDASKDRDFVLTHQDGNRYTGTVVLDTATPAKYYLQITTPDDHPKAWRLMRAQKLPANNVPFVPLQAFAAE